ncbi:hypothetical protein SAMN05421504_109143 [Amycolatopsis xylanica]|uniref:YD repeat-containing protein n=1 Tax=Amycolatopsis xylanica TaxID=589385 RepID=A0A1H3Q8I5_9PSEU|nr:hypothetical protein [Amycolatopsis xylanica]SDZ09009.1 hypothetical protein SAMN05421504_109143 [Amycolatopsis xylanica]
MRKIPLAALCASLALTVTSALPASATTAAAPCTWVASDLPLPAGAEGGSVRAAGPNGHLVGLTFLDGKLAPVTWHNRVVSTVAAAPGGASIVPVAINGDGQIAGYYGSGGSFRLRDGSYQNLPSPAGRTGYAVAINSAGDIAGRLSGGAGTETIIWPASAPGTYRIVPGGQPAGIDDAGRVVTEPGVIWSPDGSSVKLENRGRRVTVGKYQGGRIVGRFDNEEVVTEWDLTGKVVRQTPANVVMGINSSGLLAAWWFKSGTNTLGTWRDGTFLGEVGLSLRVDAVTEDDLLAGSHGPSSPWVPATWSCA